MRLGEGQNKLCIGDKRLIGEVHWSEILSVKGLSCGGKPAPYVAMGVCLFAASGLSFDVDRYLASSPFKPDTVFRKGQIPPKENPQNLARPDSGFVVLVSETDEPGIGSQVGPATEFLAKQVEELRRLRELGVDNMLLEFGTQMGARLQQSDYLPPEFINGLAALGLGLVFSSVRIPEG